MPIFHHGIMRSEASHPPPPPPPPTHNTPGDIVFLRRGNSVIPHQAYAYTPPFPGTFKFSAICRFPRGSTSPTGSFATRTVLFVTILTFPWSSPSSFPVALYSSLPSFLQFPFTPTVNAVHLGGSQYAPFAYRVQTFSFQVYLLFLSCRTTQLIERPPSTNKVARGDLCQ